MRKLFPLSLFITAALLAACSSQSGDSSNSGNTAPTSLREAKIASDFTFASTRAVSFRVKNDQASAQPLEIRNLRNQLLIRSNLSAGQAFGSEFPLPLGDNEVLVKLGGQQKTVAVVNNKISTSFQ